MPGQRGALVTGWPRKVVNKAQVLLFLTEQGHSPHSSCELPGQGGQGNSGQFSTEDSEKR